jgi:hypothetical protein
MAGTHAITIDDLRAHITWIERFLTMGGSITDLQSSIDSPERLLQIVRYIKSGAPQFLLSGQTYDASIFGFSHLMQGELPQANLGEVVIWYGGWSLQDLGNNSLVRSKKVMSSASWSDYSDWFKQSIPAGFYRLRIPVPNSGNNFFNNQTLLLAEGEQVAHPVLVVTAELCHYLQTGARLLNGIGVRTNQKYSDDIVGIHWFEGSLTFYHNYDCERINQFLSSAQPI